MVEEDGGIIRWCGNAHQSAGQNLRRQREDEEMAWATPRKMSKWPDWEEARKLENGEWRLEPEGEAEVSEIIIVSDAVVCTFVDLDGESRREQVEAKLSRRQREAPGEGCEEIKSPTRKVIRVESEEPQDHVREANCTEQEELKERVFVPSAVSVPQKPLFRCHQCSEKTLSCWQLASVVINEGEDSFTTNLCQKEVLQQVSQRRRRETTDKRAGETVCGEKRVPWKDLENDGKRTICTWDVGILSPRKKQSKEVSRAG